MPKRKADGRNPRRHERTMNSYDRRLGSRSPGRCILIVCEGAETEPNYFESNRRTYYELLLAVSQRAAWEDGLLYFLEGVKQQSQDAVNRIGRLQTLRAEYQAQIQSGRAPTRLLRAVDLLFAQPVITTRQVETALGINFVGAQRLIDQLIQAGLLREVTGGRRNRIYRADEILAILESA